MSDASQDRTASGAGEPSRSDPPTVSPSTRAGKVALNTLALIAGHAVQLPVSFVASVFVVRNLGADAYGTFVFVYAFFNLFDWLAGFGVETIAVREAARVRSREARHDEVAPPSRDVADPFPDEASVWGTALWLTTATSALAWVAALFTAAALGYTKDKGALLLVAGVEGVALVAPRLLGAVLQVRLQQWKTAAITAARHLLWLGTVIALTYSRSSLLALISTRTLLATGEMAAISLLGVRALGAPPRIHRKALGYLAKQSYPLALMYLAIGIYHRVDRVLLERLVGAGELAQYAIADNIASLVAIVPFAFSRSVYPELCRIVDDEDAFRAGLAKSFRAGMAVVGLAVVSLGAAGPLLIRIAYGSGFSRSGDLLRVLLVAQLASTYGTVLGAALLARGLQRPMTVATVVGAITNLGLNLALIPSFGAVGAAVATVISYCISGSLMFEAVETPRRLNHVGLTASARVLPALVAGAASIVSLPESAASVVAPLLGLSLLVVFGAVRPNELQAMLRLSGKDRRDGRS